MAICPTGAIEVSGRTLSPADLFDLPSQDQAATYDPLLALLQRRRSLREFKEAEVTDETIEKILDAARTAPMGIPPSDVHAMVLNSREKVRAFAQDFCDHLKGLKWFVSGWFLALMRPFRSKTMHAMYKDFIRPLFDAYIENMDKGIDLVSYDAPMAIYFYGSPYADPADPIIAATYATIAAESLGLGSCMIGGVHPCIQHGKSSKAFREKHGIKFTCSSGIYMIFGYPQIHYRKGIRRTFASDEV
jgi:nitroreductase